MEQGTFIRKCAGRLLALLVVVVASFWLVSELAIRLSGGRLQAVERTERVLTALNAERRPPPPDVPYVFPGEIRLGDFVTNRNVQQGCLLHLGSYSADGSIDKRSATNEFGGPADESYLDLRYVAKNKHFGHSFQFSANKIHHAWKNVSPTHLAMLVRTSKDGTSRQFRVEVKLTESLHIVRHVVDLEDEPLATEWEWLLMPLEGFNGGSADWWKSPDLRELVIVYEAGFLTQDYGTLHLARFAFVNRDVWQPTLPPSLQGSAEIPVRVRETKRDSVQRSGLATQREGHAAALAETDKFQEPTNYWELFDFTAANPVGSFGGGYGSWQSDGGDASSTTDEILVNPTRRLLLKYQTVEQVSVGHYFEIKSQKLNTSLDAARHPTKLRLRLRAIDMTSRFRIELKTADTLYACPIDLERTAPTLQDGHWSELLIPLERFGVDWAKLASVQQLVFVYDGQEVSQLAGSFELHSIALVP